MESGNEGGFYFKSADGVIIENNKSDRDLIVETKDSHVERR